MEKTFWSTSKNDKVTYENINFTANLDRAGNRRFYFILEEAKETVLNFHKEP